MKEVILPSGAKLQISPSPFSAAKALYQAMLEEAKNLRMTASTEIDTNFWKDLFCSGFSSKKIESCLDECMKKALYNGLHIDEKTFETVDARQDYIAVQWEVALENVLPFTKALMPQLQAALAKVKSSLA